MRRVDPAVEAPAEVVDDGMRVADTEPGVELHAAVGHAVTVGVLEEPDVGRGRGDDAVAVEHEAGDELELVGEHLLAVHHAVTVGVGENGDAILGLALGAGAAQVTAVLPRLGVGHAAAVGILGGFGDPQAAALVPVHVHDLVHQRLGGDEGQVELGVDLDLGGGLGRMRRTVGRITEGVAQFLGAAKLVDVGALTGPGDAAEEDGAVVGAVEVLVEVAGNGDERTVGLRGALEAAFVGPHLRLDVVDIDALAEGDGLGGAGLGLAVAAAAGVDRLGRVGGGEDARLGQEI